MGNINKLFSEELEIINIGATNFKEDLEKQNVEVVQLDWKIPAKGKEELLLALDKLVDNDNVEKANTEAFNRIKNSNPVLVDVDKAINVIPGMKPNTILHAGPPIEWERMCGPMKGAIIGALLYEGLAENEEEAINLVTSNEIEFSPCHEHNAVGPMAGIISPSMPVHIVQNLTYGNYAYCTINEGLGKVLRFGAYNKEVLDRLKWIERVFAPALSEALKNCDGIELKSIISQALNMGDECHNRNKASTALFFREIVPLFLNTNLNINIIRESLNFIQNNEHYFLNLSMPACKCSLDAAQEIKHSTIITAMARNGVDFGIKVSGANKDKWFVGPAKMVKGLLFPGFKEEDANLDIGDSAITETMGLGGFAMGGSPAIVKFVGGTVEDAINYSNKMYEITYDENTNYSIPNLNFRGVATGIDLIKVNELGILPIINTGIAHKKAGIGQIGAGLVNPPEECFEKALIEITKTF